MTDQLRWLTVTVPGDESAAGLESAIEPLTEALRRAQLSPSDVVHLKFWASSPATDDEVGSALAGLFPNRDQRPTVTVIGSPQAAGVATVVTVAAVEGGSVRSVYEPGRPETKFPGAAAVGDHFFVGGLISDRSDGDAKTQAEDVFARLSALVTAAGGSPSNLGHMFVWYADHSVRDVINGPFLEMFTTPGDRPSRHSVVRTLPPGTLLMIEAAGSLAQPRSAYTIGGLWHGGIGGVPNSLPFGTLCGDLLFSAGTYGRDPSTDEIPDDLAAQTKWALHYSHEFLRVAGMNAGNVRQIYVWIRNEGDTDEVTKAVESSFGTDGPSLSIQLIQAKLPGTNQIQIELVAQASPVVENLHDAMS